MGRLILGYLYFYTASLISGQYPEQVRNQGAPQLDPRGLVPCY